MLIGVCTDTDNGRVDMYGDNCAAYAINTGWCGSCDGSGFCSTQICCACGGGSSWGNNMSLVLSNF